MGEKSLVSPVYDVESQLGYRGFIVRSMSEGRGPLEKAGLPTDFRIGGLRSLEPESALWMLQTSEKKDSQVDDFLRDKVRNSIIEIVEDESRAPEKGPGQSCVSNYLTSSTNFSFWNGTTYHQQNNNCYNFASNYRSNTFAQPGRVSGSAITQAQCYCGTAANKVRADGYSDYCLGGSAQNISIALVIDPGWDFHFYRLCTSGRWCHKAGSTPATNRDNSGNYISNPETCNRGDYTDFCGYFFADGALYVQ
jgi:hypothetical protein